MAALLFVLFHRKEKRCVILSEVVTIGSVASILAAKLTFHVGK